MATGQVGGDNDAHSCAPVSETGYLNLPIAGVRICPAVSRTAPSERVLSKGHTQPLKDYPRQQRRGVDHRARGMEGPVFDNKWMIDGLAPWLDGEKLELLVRHIMIMEDRCWLMTGARSGRTQHQSALSVELCTASVRQQRDDRRRANHNEIERRRRDKINNWIHELNKIIPAEHMNSPSSETQNKQNNGGQGENLSKGGILAKACEYITRLKDTSDKLTECLAEKDQILLENLQLKESINQLLAENKRLQSQLQFTLETNVKLES
ncbi:hypothetical protein ZHAS_00000824 [Anopheles sinensis]|uniref:BHLH domain-containing protein n=1 Tax=Anopheles sinensis TaxID=74873 RepID=A0A084VAL4_ANOSI|nr:hypothetical protein ZHAS_00000824 [Anopheles sinensis]